MALPKLYRVHVEQEYIAEDTIYAIAFSEEEAEEYGRAAAELEPESAGLPWASANSLALDLEDPSASIPKWKAIAVSPSVIGKEGKVWEWYNRNEIAKFFDPELLEQERIRRIEADNGQLSLLPEPGATGRL